jgi:hypothetical protein
MSLAFALVATNLWMLVAPTLTSTPPGALDLSGALIPAWREVSRIKMHQRVGQQSPSTSSVVYSRSTPHEGRADRHWLLA